MQNRTIEPYAAPAFAPPLYAIAVNALFFASLGVVLVAAVLCMLVKGWIRELDRKLRRIPDLRKRSVVKELREQGMLRWWLPEIIAVLPTLILLSLLLFFIGLTVYLFYIHKLPAFLSISIFGAGLLVSMLSIFVSAIDEFSPFRSAYSRALGRLYRRLYSHLADSLNSYSTMALPRTTTEKIREWVNVFFQEHLPLSEETILELSSSSSDEIMSRMSVPILNKLFSSIAEWDASAYSKNISMGILLQLDDPNIRSPGIWPFIRHYDTSNLSLKEAQCLAYSICMQDHNIYNRNWKGVVEVLNQSSDPWFRLVASLLWVRCIDVVGIWSRIPAREADILHAISNTEHFSTERWCFALSSMMALFPRGMAIPQQTRAFTRILARLLQKRVYYMDRSMVEGDGSIDFWLYTMTSILDGDLPADQIRVTSSLDKFLHTRDLEAYGRGMVRDPNCTRRLFQLSRKNNLDPSLMRGCLVSILFTLLRLNPSNQQEVRLVNQYLEIIEEEMDVISWSFSLAEFFTNQRSWPYGTSNVVSCLLRGRHVDLVDADGYVAEYGGPIMEGYDLKLSAANAQPTTSILEVMDYVVTLSPDIGTNLQNAWLSLYINNRTRSPHNSAIPTVWSSDCASIALNRLSLYNSGLVPPEIDLVLFFLSCPSASIACRALYWYLRLRDSTTTPSNHPDFISFPIIFRKGLSAEEICESWSLLADVLIPSWEKMPVEWRARFVETFFGDGSAQEDDKATTEEPSVRAGVGDEEKSLYRRDVGPTASITQTDGLGWMEDVWTTVLRPLVREVHIARVNGYWPELSRVMPEAYPEPVSSNEPNASLDSSDSVGWGEEGEGMPQGGAAIILEWDEERLETSGRGLLGVLASLVEAGAEVMPAELLDRLGSSLLLSDERLIHDAVSLSRIRAVLNRHQAR
jgi:hypothetical protein